MAVPKKRTSKSRKNTRKTVWKMEGSKQKIKALSIAKTVLKKLVKEQNQKNQQDKK